MGFMDAVPKGAEVSRSESIREATGKAPEMPPLQAGGYLLDILLQVGPCSVEGGIMVPLSWREIESYHNMTNTLTASGDAEAIMEMSREYCAGYHIGSDPLGIPPFGETQVNVDPSVFTTLRARAAHD